MTTAEIIFLACNVLIIIFTSLALYYHNRAFKVMKQNLDNANEHLELLHHKLFMTETCLGLFRAAGLEQLELEIREDAFCYSLIANAKCNEVIQSALIKRFFFEPSDQEDKDYAYRCAEELKELIESDTEVEPHDQSFIF